MPPEQYKTYAVRCKREQADNSNGLEHRDLRENCLVNCLPENEKTKCRHDAAFEQGGNGLHSCAARDNVNAEAVNQSIAKHIQRIRYQ